MGSDVIVGVIGSVLIAMGLMEFKKEMTLLKMEFEGTKIETEKTNKCNWLKALYV
ncbi:hypothetical protein G9F73_008405 [Clostridium estertheticum]|uniref:hypothetical protein n=1 Tax=Clostridium estertheticum TaxID=238834 RepID=UPI0013EEAF94|nr:hypothetical protein [Clostridium estertheticum]MBZ9607833.1 hypothetical protein [Clostridium estertheticum]